FGARTGNRADDAVRRYFANSIVKAVSNVEISWTIDDYTFGLIELTGCSWTAITAKSLCSVSRYRLNDSVAGYPSNPIVTRIGNVDVSRRIDADALRVIQRCRYSRHTVLVTRLFVTCNRGYYSADSHFTNTLILAGNPVADIRDVKVAGRIER